MTVVKPYHLTNAPTYGSFATKTSTDLLSHDLLNQSNRGTCSKWKCYPLHWNLLESFDVNNFGSNNSEEKKKQNWIICKWNQFT